MNEAPLWNKATFAAWLSGPYRTVADHARTSSAWHPLPLCDSIDSRMVTRLLRSAYAEVRRALTHTELERGIPKFASSMRAGSFVTELEDHEGTMGYVPTFAARRLPDVVLTLFAADCLFRPVDYVKTITFCGRCQALSFDAGGRMRGHCPRHVGMFAPASALGNGHRVPEGA